MVKKILCVIFILLVGSVTTAAPTGYWSFDDPNGMTVADVTGNGNNGVLYAANSSNYPLWIAGHDGTGGALRFNANTTGSSNCNHVVVDIDSTDPLANLGEAFSIAMWVRRDALGCAFGQGWPRLVHTDAYDVELALDPDSTDTGGYDPYDIFWADLGGLWRLKMGLETTVQKTLGNWYHLAITCDGLDVKKYINGVAVYSVSAPEPYALQATTDLRFGAASDGSAYLTGALDDLAIWAGTYLPEAEVAKLANGTATPLTVVDEGPYVSPYPPDYFTIEGNLAWNVSGWKLLYGPSFSTFSYWPGENITVHSNNTATVWYIKDLPSWETTVMIPGGHYAMWSTGQQWYSFRDLTPENYYGASERNVDNFGMAWIDPSWSGVDPNIAKFAPYITPGIALCIPNNNGYESATLAWGKDFFKTYARVATVNGDGISLRVKSYSYVNGTNPLEDPNTLTLLGEVYWPLPAEDHVWEELKYAYPKPMDNSLRVWTEISIANGDPNNDTVVYIDEFNPISDQANTSQHNATYFPGDTDQDAIVNHEDLTTLAVDWLDNSTGVLDPRSGGLLVNGDFSADLAEVVAPDASVLMTPTGWTVTGTGDYGVLNTSQRGRTGWYYTMDDLQPAGGNVAAFTTDMYAGDPDGVLSQTASETVVSGQTYYAMGYVMAYKYTSGNDLGEWYGWRDTATMEIVVDGVVKTTVSRRLSRSIWRPLYGTYTAVPADAGKSISIQFSYDNSYTSAYPDASNMNVGYAYLDTVMPDEWPEERQNELANGGFEDLSVIQTAIPDLYTSLTTSDNSGGWLVTGAPALLPNWIYEVPTGYDLNNQGGIFSSAYYGSPIPSPGMNDVVVYGSGTFVLGQIVGALTPGVTYYLDTACGVLVDPLLWGVAEYTWPSPAPALHIELWQIPSGVTDPDTIHTGVTTSQPGYVKIANADVDSTGDIKQNYKWQVIGTSYTATSADTNVYVRIYGTNPVSYTYPSFVVSDAYLSTQKRLVASSSPGNSLAVNVSSGVQYDALGPYNCYQATLLGLDAPEGDMNGDCMVNLVDLAFLADNWLEDWYTNITGTAPWE